MQVRDNIILDWRKFNYPIIHRAATMEFPDRYNAANVCEEFREDCILFRLCVNRLFGNGICERKWRSAETYDRTRKPGKSKNYNEKGGMIRKGHFRDSIIIGLRELTIPMKEKIMIMVGIPGNNGAVVSIAGIIL